MTDIVLVTFNNSGITIQCLHSIFKHTAIDDCRIIWVDNGSQAEEREAVAKAIKESGIKSLQIQIAENVGFPKGANRGILASMGSKESDYLVLMNNDIIIPDSGWLGKMIEFQKGHPRAGIIGCLTDSGAVQNYERYVKITGYESGDPIEYHKFLPPMIKEITSTCIPFSLVMLNKKMVYQVGLLDDEFSPGYGEDDDYCDRARLAGWRTLILLNVIVIHRHGLTFKKLFTQEELGKIRQKNLFLYQTKYNKRRGLVS